MTTSRNDCSRSIPACAGEPCQPANPTGRTQVYPRVCGGTPTGGRVVTRRGGLSPRVRGNHLDSEQCRSLHTVYPRVCGGTQDVRIQCRPLSGLSPRVRGNPGAWPGSSSRRRSIPACAGEPCRRPRRGVSTKVYPRVCGGTWRTPRSPSPWRGLSPRVRGNLFWSN